MTALHPHEHTLLGCLRICAIAGVVVISAGAVTVFVTWRMIEKKTAPTGCNGSPERGQQLVVAYGCVACHDIPGVAPRGRVGPSLIHMATRSYIGGQIGNEPIAMQNWLQDPARLKPGTAMPNVAVGERDARDITAYLATLK